MKSLILLGIALLLVGCGANGVVTDFAKQTSRISNMKIDGGGDLDIFTGGTLFSVPLKKIRSLRLRQEETVNVGEKHFVLAEVMFADGTKYGTFNANSPTPKAWVRSDQFLFGKSAGGKVRILVGDIAKLDVTLE